MMLVLASSKEDYHSRTQSTAQTKNLYPVSVTWKISLFGVPSFLTCESYWLNDNPLRTLKGCAN